MFDMSTIYKPITATAFRKDETYIEIPPSDLLKPYIRCFWGTAFPVIKSGVNDAPDGLVIPDTCMDVIFNIEHTNNRVFSFFCGINDRTFKFGHEKRTGIYSCFAIRMYAWAVPMLSQTSMNGVKNIFCEVENYFPYFNNGFGQSMLEITDIHERQKIVEKILLRNLSSDCLNNDVLNSLLYIFRNNGAASVSEIADNVCLSKRQLERRFSEYIGLSPKKLNDLIRYQLLWREIALDKCFDINEAVFKFGYSDQAHLLNDFKKYHTLSINEAKKAALGL